MSQIAVGVIRNGWNRNGVTPGEKGYINGHPPPTENGFCKGKGDSTLPSSVLRTFANDMGCDVFGEEFAHRMDKQDPLASFRHRFSYPKMKELPCCDPELVNFEDDCVYLCGNSLGLKPKAADRFMKSSLDAWGKWGVLSHFIGDLPAAKCDLPGLPAMAKLVGAKPEEVALMNGLTVNLHLLLVSFYRPTAKRYKIVMEAHAFPSDIYAVKSQVRIHGLDPDRTIITIEPRQGEHNLRTEDILNCIEKEGNSIALVLFSGIQYYTGQKFDMEAITKVGHKMGCTVGFDLAHAVGNIKINLHDWDVDFACWCSYKYLNSGAGGIAGAFIHEKFLDRNMPKLHGWWSNNEETRFLMKDDPDVAPGVAGLRISNPPPWLAALNLASLEIFEQTSMEELIRKQFLLTGYLELLIHDTFGDSITVITPTDPKQRGCQLSIMFKVNLESVHDELHKRGTLCDIRKPHVMRVAPAPLYNSFYDVYRFVRILKKALGSVTDTE